jgi:hypothetical protein
LARRINKGFLKNANAVALLKKPDHCWPDFLPSRIIATNGIAGHPAQYQFDHSGLTALLQRSANSTKC